VPLAHVRSALERFESLQINDHRPSADDMRELAEQYEYATNWLRVTWVNATTWWTTPTSSSSTTSSGPWHATSKRSPSRSAAAVTKTRA
jgi:hypothetical protein